MCFPDNLHSHKWHFWLGKNAARISKSLDPSRDTLCALTANYNYLNTGDNIARCQLGITLHGALGITLHGALGITLHGARCTVLAKLIEEIFCEGVLHSLPYAKYLPWLILVLLIMSSLKWHFMPIFLWQVDTANHLGSEAANVNQ